MQNPIIWLPAVIGVVVIVLGRWLYKNPRRVIPGWGFLNPEHPRVQRLARAYATFFIFFGVLVSLGFTLGVLVHRVPGMPLLIFAVAVAGAWLLRPKLPQPEAPVSAPAGETVKPRLLTKHWKRNLAIAGGLMGLLIVVVFWIIGDSDVCKLAFATAEANPVVRQRLGEPITRGFFISGNIEISGPTGHADIAIPVSGPRGKATVYAVALKSAGLWKFETLQIGFDEGGARVDLLNEKSGTAVP